MHDEGTRFGLGRLPSDMRFEELSKLLSIGNCNIPAHDVLAVRKRLAKSGFLKLVKRSVFPLRAFLARVELERRNRLVDHSGCRLHTLGRGPNAKRLAIVGQRCTVSSARMNTLRSANFIFCSRRPGAG
jgi:hypothetical protein